MAKETKVIEIRAELSDTIKKIGQLTQSINDNTEAISKLKKTDADYQQTLGNLKTQIAAATQERRKLIAAVVDEEKILKKRAAEIDKQVAKEQAQRAKTDAIFIQSLEKEQARLEKQKKQEQDYLNKKIATEQKVADAARISAEKREGYLNQLVQSVNDLEKAYYRLSEAELKGTQGATILKNLKEQRSALATAQAEYGKYSMNVGNYASATNMLAINLGQVMKEVPNFAISARIGIMSLTNNLPMLAEAFKAVRVQQQEMIAQGKKVPSMFSLITKSVFGLTGIMSIAMVLLQLFSEDIINLFKNTSKADEAFKEFNNTLKEGNNFYTEASVSIEKMTNILESAAAGLVDSEDALKQYNSTLGDTFGVAENVNVALKYISDNKDKYIMALIEMAEAQNIFTSSVNASSEMIGKMRGGKPSFTDYLQAIFNPKYRAELIGGMNLSALAYKAYLDEIQKLNQSSEKQSADYAQRMADIRNKYKNEPFFESLLGVEDEDDKKQKEKIDKAVKRNKSGLDRVNRDIEQFTAKIRKEIFDFNKTLVQSGRIDEKAQDDFVKKYIKNIEDLKKGQEAINEIRIMFRQMAVNDADLELATLELQGKNTYEAQKNLLEAQRNLEVEAAKQRFDDIAKIEEYYAAKSKEIERKKNIDKAELFVRYAKAVTQMANSIDSYMKASNEAELQNYAQTITGKANYDELYAEKKYELEYESAKRQKAIGIFSTLVDTAQAIISVWADKIPTSAKIIFSALAGATGLIQTAAIAKQPLPVPPTASTGSKISGTSTVKFHSGGVAGSTPDSQQRSEEITRTLLTTERVLSPQQTSIFDSLVAKVSAMGGSGAIVSGAAQTTSDVDRMYIAMSKALRDMPSPVMTWQEFERQQDRQKRLKNNAIIK